MFTWIIFISPKHVLEKLTKTTISQTISFRKTVALLLRNFLQETK